MNNKKVKRCVIITAYCKNKLRDCIDFNQDDFIICADAGHQLADAEGIKPDMIIGDFDSGARPATNGSRIIELPVIKDDTDTLSCLRYALSLKAKEIVILGGIGGRLDHTIANLQLLSFALEAGSSCMLTDGDNIVTMVSSGKYRIKRREGYTLSLFAFTNECTDVTVKGVQYPLYRAKLHNSFPLGVSNNITADSAVISLEAGKLLIIQSKNA
jgi:thiamine pyrophosphokinase